jgi:ankyrin repeat protein
VTGSPQLQSRFRRVAAEPDAVIGEHGETALHLAAQEGNMVATAQAIAAGATVFVLDRRNKSPLIYAVEAGAAGVVRQLVRASQKGINHSIAAGSALGIAAQRGDADSVRELLDGGANINAVDDMGSTPLMDAVFAGHKEVVKLLLERGADANILRMGEGALHLAARKGDPDILDLLLSSDAIQHIHQQTRMQAMSPLHIAVLTGQHGSAKKLLESGAFTHLRNKQELTPLMMAAQQGDAAMIRLLVTRGYADMRATGGDYAGTPLHIAVRADKMESVRELMNLGADPQATDLSGWTPLELAAFHGRTDIARELLEAAPHTRAQLASALRIAIKSDHGDTARMLAASPHIDINAPDAEGRYVLNAAVTQFDAALLRDILKAGANPNLADPDGLTPLARARRDAPEEFVAILEQAEKDYVTRSHFPKSSAPQP